MDIKLEERAGELVIITPQQTLTVAPVPAKLGASMLAHTMNISLDGGVDIGESDMEALYKNAMGADTLKLANETLRLPVFQTIVHVALFWQISGIDAAQGWIDGGVGKAMEVHLAKMGLSLSQILSLMGEGEKTPEPDDTNATSIPPTFAAKSKTPASRKPKAAPSSGKTSSATGTKSSATSTPSTESTGATTP